MRNYILNPKRLIFVLILVLLPLSSIASELSVLTYNIYMRWPTWIFRNDHDWRAGRIPQYVRGYDVVVLQEAFADEQRNLMLEALQEEYPYHTRPLGENEYFSHNGGVMILSRWPIADEANRVFEGCAGSDCMVKKGVVHAVIQREGERVHVFGLHLQAQKEYSAERVAQFAQVQEFIESRDLAADELVLVAGDFNVDFYSDELDGEFTGLTTELGLELPQGDLKASYDKATNTYTDENVSERLDYIFYSNRHHIPLEASNTVLQFKVDGIDLSDHHPVRGDFRWEGASE
jgi:endonuclease/exonuclease/phosphatase family metal-dependent hydrolase